MPIWTPAYGFYEKVVVRSAVGERTRFADETGAVMGRSQGDDGVWWYAIHLYGRGTSAMFPEAELATTGEFDRRETFYDGTVVRVHVDRKGRGSITT